MIDLATLTAKIVADTSGFAEKVQDAQQTLDRAGEKMVGVGKVMTAGVTLPIVGIGTAAVLAGNQFNAGMADIASLGEEASSRIAAWSPAIQQVAIDVGKGTGDMTKGMYMIVSAYGAGDESVQQLSLNAKLAAAGLSTTSEAIALTSAVTKGFGDTSAAAQTQVADLAMKTVQMGQVTFPELASAIGLVVPIASTLGVTQQELFAVMATGTGVTGTASQVSTQFRGVLQSLMSPTADMTTLIESMGFKSGEAMLQSKGLQGTIDAVVAAAEASGTPLQSYIGSIEGQTLALTLAGPQAAVFTEKLKAMESASGTMQAAFEAQTEGVNRNGFAMEQAKVKVEVMMEKLSNGLAPAITLVIERVSPLIDKVVELAGRFGDMDPRMQTIILAVLGIVAAIGPLLMIIGTLLPALGALATGVAAVGAAMAVVLSPIGLVVLAIAAVIAIVAALVVAWNNDWGGIQTKTREYLGDIGDRVAEGMGKVRQEVEDGLKLIRGWWDEHGESVRTIVRVLWEALNTLVEAGVNLVKGIIEAALAAIKGFWDAHGATITTVAKNTWEMIKGIIKGVLDVIGALVDAFAALLTGDWERLGDALEDLWRAAWGIVETIMKTAKANLIAIATDIKATITARIEEMRSAVAAKVEALRSGVVAKFNELKSQASSAVSGLKDSVLGILGSLASEAFGRGAALVQRLADGIRSAIGAVVSAASALAAQIRRFLPGSDAEVGPLSDIYASGKALGTTIAAGILASSAAPAAAASVMAGGISDVLDLLKANIVDVVAALAELAGTFAGGEAGSNLASARAGLDAYVPVVQAFGQVLEIVQQAIQVEVVDGVEERLAALTGMVARVIPGFVAAMVLAAAQFTTTGWLDSVKAFSEGAIAAVAPVADGIEGLIALHEGIGKLDGKWIDKEMGAFVGILGGLVEYMRRVGLYFTQEGWVESVQAFSEGAVAATAPVENGVKALIAINTGVGQLDGNWIDSRMDAFVDILGGLVEYMRRAGNYFNQEGWVEKVKDFSAGAIAATAPVENGIKALVAINDGVKKLNGSTIGDDMEAFTAILGGLVENMRRVAVQFTTTGLESVKAFSTAAGTVATQLVDAAEAIVEKGLPAAQAFANASATIGDNIIAGMEFVTRPVGFAPGIVGAMQMIQDAVVGANYNIQAAWGSLAASAYLFGQNWIGQLINGINSRMADLDAVLRSVNSRFNMATSQGYQAQGAGVGAAQGGGGGNTYNVNVYNPAAQAAEDSLLRQMRNLAVVGAI